MVQITFSIKLDKSNNKAVTKILDQQKEQEYELMTKGYSDYFSTKKNKAIKKRRGRKKKQKYELKKYNSDFLNVRMPIMSVKENAAHYLLLGTHC